MKFYTGFLRVSLVILPPFIIFVFNQTTISLFTMWWITLGLILLGVILMLIEMLLVFGVGVAGVFSFLSFGAACWYTFVYIGPSEGWWVTSIVLLLLVIMVIVILRGRTWKRFELKTEINSKVNEDSSLVKVGDKGFAHTRLAPMGTGKFGDITVEVKSANNALLGAGTEIEIVEITDNQVLVKPITSDKQ